MEMLAKVVLGVGVISMVIGVILRLMLREIALGLTPSSFLEFSIACLLLAIALKVVSK
jgi:branched-subunit amino acid transport protein